MKSNKSGKRSGQKPAAPPAARTQAAAAPVTASQRRAPGAPATLSAFRWEESLGHNVVWAILAFFTISLLQNGLFFIDVQKPGVFLALLMGTAIFLLVQPPIQWRDPMIWGVIALLGGYLFALPGAARPGQALHGVTIAVAVVLMFLMGRVAIRGKNAPFMVSGGVVAATVLLFGQSLLNLAGILHSVDSIIGSRMSSLLQYSNTFALVCTVGVLAAAALALRGDRWWALWHLGFNIGVSGIILSQSRAMYLLLPILLLLWGFFVGRSVVGEVVFYAFDSLAALLIGLVLYIPSNNQLSRSPWVLGVTAILWVMSYYGVILLRVLVQRLGRNSRVAAWATGGLLLIAFAGVFIRFSQSIFTRLGSLKLSDPAVLGRIYTLIDGLRIVQAHPLGLGVDGWRASYFKYASYFYITNAAHSYWIEVAVSAGALGIFALLFVLVVWASRLWRRMRQLPTQSDLGYATNLAIALGTVAIIVHSAIDWDLAFLSLLLFFWFLVGYVDGWSVPAPLARPTGLNRPVVAVVGLAVMTVVAMQWSGDGALNQGVRLLQQKNYSQAIDNLHKAAARDPWNGFTHADLAMAYIAAAPPKDPQAEHMAEQELELARRYDRMNYQTYIRQGRFYRQRERFVEAEHAMKEAVSVGPWRPDAWANLVSVYTKAVEVAIKRGDSDAVTRWVLAGRDALRSYEQQLTTQPAFTQNNAAVRFPENDPDLTQSLADFRKIQAAVPQA